MEEEKTGVLSVLSRLGRDLLADTALQSRPLADGAVGYVFQVREPFYTSVALSSVEEIAVTINGYAVPAGEIWLSLRGQAIPGPICKNICELYWHMGETAELLLTDPALTDILAPRSALQLQVVIRPAHNYGLPENRITYTAESELEVTK